MNTTKKLITLGVVGVVILIIGAIIAVRTATFVGGHEVGVVYSAKDGVQEEPLGQGLKFTHPLKQVIKYPTATQSKQYEALSAATVDGKTLSFGVTIDYHTNPERAPEVYQKFGSVSMESLEQGHIKGRVNDALRMTVADFTVIEAFGEKTGEIRNAALEYVQKELSPIGIEVEKIMIAAPQPDAETQAAIDDRVKATQELERKKTDKAIAKEEAERKKIEAEGEAEANRIVQESLSPEVLEQQKIEKWSGQNPINIGGEGVIVDLPKAEKESK